MSGQKLGSSGKHLEISLAAEAAASSGTIGAVPPFSFEDVFVAAYPNTGVRSFVSRTILALDGPGTLVVTDGEGDEVTLTLEDREFRSIEAVGIVTYSGVSRIAVML